MGTLRLDNHRQYFGSWLIVRFNVSWLSWAHQSISTRFSWSMSEILWGHTICCNAPTLKTQDLDPNYLYLVASFPVQWTLAHGSAGKRQCSVNGVPVLRHAETGSRRLINGEGCPCWFCLDYLSVLVIIVVTFTVDLSEKLDKIQALLSNSAQFQV